MKWLREFFKSSYVRMLEEENACLKAENRALTNSLLGTAGFPPVDFPSSPPPRQVPRPRHRSWQQIQAVKENEARK